MHPPTGASTMYNIQLYSQPLAAHRRSFDRSFRDKDFEINNQLLDDCTRIGKLKGV